MQTKRECLEAAARGRGSLGRAADDEYVFVLRSQDLTFLPTVFSWIELVERLSGGCATGKTNNARSGVIRAAEWQRTHQTKVPD